MKKRIIKPQLTLHVNDLMEKKLEDLFVRRKCRFRRINSYAKESAHSRGHDEYVSISNYQRRLSGGCWHRYGYDVDGRLSYAQLTGNTNCGRSCADSNQETRQVAEQSGRIIILSLSVEACTHTPWVIDQEEMCGEHTGRNGIEEERESNMERSSERDKFEGKGRRDRTGQGWWHFTGKRC